MKTRFVAAAALTGLMLLQAPSDASAQVNCNVVADRAIRMTCHRQSISAQQQYINAIESNIRQIDRYQRGFNYVDQGMNLGTRVIQGMTRGRVPANTAYNAGRMIGQGGATWYLRQR